MKIVITLLIATGLAACGSVDARTIQSGIKPSTTSTMELSRTYTGAGETSCQAKHRWQECRSTLTPAEATGGSE